MNNEILDQKCKSGFERIYVKDFFVILSFIILLFQNLLVNLNGLSFLSYYDEIIEALMIIYLIFNIRKLKYMIERTDKLFIAFYFLAILICLFSTILFRYQAFIPSFLDLFVCLKFLIGYVFFQTYTLNRNIVKSRYFNNFIIFIALLTFMIFLVDIIFDIYPKYDMRYGLYSISLFLKHPLNLSFYLISIVMILTYEGIKRKLNLVCIFCCLLMLFMTLRTASLCFVGVYLLCLFNSLFKFKYEFIKPVLIGSLVMIFGLLIGLDQIDYYYSGDLNTVRSVMLRDGFNYSLANFPFGLGFGTFGSSSANVYSSIFYNQNGYYSLWNFTYFSTDSFLALSLGQFGLIGTFLLIISIIILVVKSLKCKIDLYFISLVPVIIYIFVSILSTTSIFHPSSFLFICLFSFIYRDYKIKKYSKDFE